MGKIISIINQKGGVGKTTTTVNLGAGLNRKGKKILLVDLDPQANLTSSVGLQPRDLGNTIYDLLKDEVTLKDIVINCNGMDVIPSSVALSGADIELSNRVGRELLLKEALNEAADSYDYILIDCPPTLGLLTLNALTASKSILIPIQAGYLPLEGISLLFETIELVKKRINNELSIGGIIITMFDSRQNLQKEVIEIIRERFEDKLFNTYIRNNVALAEAPSFGQDIFSYKPNSAGAKDYESLCKEVIEREVI